MKMRKAAGALVMALALLGPAPSALADDSGSDTQHNRYRQCYDHGRDRHHRDHDYRGDYKYRGYEGDSLQDHNRTGDDWRYKNRCHRSCRKGHHDWHYGNRCDKRHHH
jgi:hypothetical protein